MVSLATNAVPQVKLYYKVAQFLIRGVGVLMRENRDDQVGIIYQSWNRRQHYPHGFRQRIDVRDMSGNLWVDYSMFGME